jgi:hypothetical protein
MRTRLILRAWALVGRNRECFRLKRRNRRRIGNVKSLDTGTGATGARLLAVVRAVHYLCRGREDCTLPRTVKLRTGSP